MQKGEFTLVLEGLREFNERRGVSESSGVAEGVLQCIREMKKEGIDKEVIMRVMESSFHVIYLHSVRCSSSGVKSKRSCIDRR